MVMPPVVDDSHGQPSWPRKGFIPPPLGAPGENGGPDSSSSFAWPPPAAPAWATQPLPWGWGPLSDGFSTPPPSPPPRNWSPYPTIPTPYPQWTDRSSTLMAEPPTPRGKDVEGTPWGQPISANNWPEVTPFPGAWPVFRPSTEGSGKGWFTPKPCEKRRRKTWSSCTTRDGSIGMSHLDTPGPTYRRSWIPDIVPSFDGSISPAPVFGPLPYNLPHQPPPVGAAPYRRDDPENLYHLPDLNEYRAYVANDPFVPSLEQSITNIASPSGPTITPSQDLFYAPTKAQIPPTSVYGASRVPISRYILAFLFDTVPRQIYLYTLLTLTSIYFSRVASIFEQAGLTMSDIKGMAMTSANWKASGHASDPYIYHAPPVDSPPVAQLKESWGKFTDSLMFEWMGISFVSVLVFLCVPHCFSLRFGLTIL
ncbi:hypothetical protein C0992_005228 [Termitomyces sp. T32_za158]|nr:hypothetical protein C0992_005228 [Termitomyces sp. T32_za158]